MEVMRVGRGAGARAWTVSASRRLWSGLPTEGVVWMAAAGALAAGGVWRLHVTSAGALSAVETATTISASAGALLLGLRFRTSRQLHDLLLLVVLVTVSLSDFVFNHLVVDDAPLDAQSTGARLAGALLVTWAFLAIALTQPGRSVDRRLLPVAVVAGLGWVGLGAVAARLGRLATGFTLSSRPLVACGVVAFSGLFVAGMLLSHHHRAPGTEERMMQLAIILLAVAQMSRVSLPVAAPAWITPTVLITLAAYGLLLGVAILRYRAATRKRMSDAVAEERRRIARDLHDGVAQDLAFIAAHCDRLAGEHGEEHPLTIAARRALAAYRGQIVDLEASHAPSTEQALREIACELAARHGISVEVIGSAGARAPRADASVPGRRRELVRIAREAIANAARHGGAKNVTLVLGAAGDDVLLRVSDDGCGLKRGAEGETGGSGTGLNTMHDRAQRAGAQLCAGRGEHGGTEIRVVCPR